MTKRQADVQFKIILLLHNRLHVYDQKPDRSESELFSKISLKAFNISIISVF